jgi:hypothetical protein
MLKRFSQKFNTIFFCFSIKKCIYYTICNKQSKHITQKRKLSVDNIKYNYKLSFKIVLTEFLCLLFVKLYNYTIFVLLLM